MENWLYAELSILIKTSLSVLVIFTIIVIIIRIAGLRTFAKMSSFDFATTIALGSILASVALSQDVSLAKGAVAMSVIVFWQFGFAFAKRKFSFFKKAFTNSPILLMDGSEILYQNLRKTNVSEADLMAKLREANVLQLSQVQAVVLETTGDVSVLHSPEQTGIDDKIMQGVNK